MNHTRMDIQRSAGTRFRREGLPSRDADLVRLVDRALRSHSRDQVAAWVPSVGEKTLPALAMLRALALLPEVAMSAYLLPEQLAGARAAAVSGSGDYGAVSMANAIWARAALHVQFPGDVIESAWRFGVSSARATGGEASTFVQEMLVAAGLGQLRDGAIDKSQELLGYLEAEHPETPARWMMLARRLADVEVHSGRPVRSHYLHGLPESKRAALSHDDLVDLAEAEYLYTFGSPVANLDEVRLAETDPAGLRMPHRTPLMRRASQRAYRVARLTTALGARPAPWMSEPSIQDGVERAYLRAILATAAFNGVLWAGGRPPTMRLVDVCDWVVSALARMADERADVAVEVIDRVLGFSARLEEPVPATSTVAARLLAWVRECGPRQPIAVETVLALLPFRADIAGSAADAMATAVQELTAEALGTIAWMDFRDAAHGTEECWGYLRALGRAG